MSSDLSDISIALIIIAAAIVLSWVSGYALGFLTSRLFRRTRTTLDDALVDAATGALRIAIIVAGVQIALQQIALIPDQWRGGIEDTFFVIYLGIVVVAAFRLIDGLTRWYAKEVVYRTETELDDIFLSFFRALAKFIAVAIGVIFLLGHFGIEPSALVTTLGIGTLAVALAAQETLSDVISGFMIMLDRPFAVGDRVELLDIQTWGDVTAIGLRSTRILTRDNRMVAVPNSVIGKGLVVNYSDPSTVYRVQTHVGVAYGTDLELVRQVLIDAILAENWVMQDRPVEALMLEFGESALIFRVRCWIEHYVEKRRVIDKMNSALYRALADAEIIIPLPQREILLNSASVLPDISTANSPGS